MEAWAEAQADFHEMREAEAEKGNKIDAEEAWPEYWEKARMEKLN